MTVKELNAWCWRGDGTWWLGRATVKWAIEDEARRRAQSETRPRSEADWAARGFTGGRVDPHESAIFEDEGAAA